MRIVLTVFLLISMSLMAACQSLGYYAQSARGQFQVFNQSKPIATWLVKKNTDHKLKQKLQLIQQIRDFASDELKLPRNKSYTQYADIDRNYVVWNIFAAPKLSLKPYRWCYPIVGCQAYRGYFSRQPALNYADGLKTRGFDVSVGGVRAYSTLGWFNDPVLNTFINYPKNDLAGLIFHELSHQVAYIKGDTIFNESFATLIENRGVEKWLLKNASQEDVLSYREKQTFENTVIALILRHKQALQYVYQSHLADATKLSQKILIFAALKSEYQHLKENNNIEKSAWDSWFARDLNNANLIAIGSYYDYVDEFDKLFESMGGDFALFLRKIEQLARLSALERADYFNNLKNL